MKTKKLITAMAFAIGLPSSALAGVLFDPDGAGGLGAMDLGSIDWHQTSMLALGGPAAIQCAATGVCGPNGVNFDLLTHAYVDGFTNSAGDPNNPAGLNSTFEITMVARFTETVTQVVPLGGGSNLATFITNPATPGFLEFYFDSSPDADDLTGSGFSDGRLILRASLVSLATGNFTASATTDLLDRWGADNYNGQLTQTGSGSNTALSVGTPDLTYDPTFFLGLLSSLSLTFANISQGIPFFTVDPSDCFTDTAYGGAVGTISAGECSNAHIGGTYAAQGADPTGYTPLIGLINGFLPAFTGGGPDQVFQTDYNTAFNATSVPEPGTLALLGLGLGLSALLRRRRDMRHD